jgi:hypothetical protein
MTLLSHSVFTSLKENTILDNNHKRKKYYEEKKRAKVCHSMLDNYTHVQRYTKKLVRNYRCTTLEKKLRRKLGFVDGYTDYIPEEFLSFVKQLKEIEPLCTGFYKVMNRVWQDVSISGNQK